MRRNACALSRSCKHIGCLCKTSTAPDSTDSRISSKIEICPCLFWSLDNAACIASSIWARYRKIVWHRSYNSHCGTELTRERQRPESRPGWPEGRGIRVVQTTWRREELKRSTLLRVVQPCINMHQNVQPKRLNGRSFGKAGKWYSVTPLAKMKNKGVTDSHVR